MKALIFAAGLGTRLRPMTDCLPKALIPIAGKPLLEHVVEKLIAAGVDQIIVNVHHFPHLIEEFLKLKSNFGIQIEISNESDQLLDTGGGLKKASWFFDDNQPFFVHNVDIFSNVNLKNLYQQHVETNSMATLVVSKRDTFRYLLFDDSMKLCGWINEKTNETKPKELKGIQPYNKLAFAGIQVVSPSIFGLMEKDPVKFSIMDFYLSNMKNIIISGFVQNDCKIFDVGKLETIHEAENFIF